MTSSITEGMLADRELQELSFNWLRAVSKHKYAYQFRWLGIPIIQLPQDMIAAQELIWQIKPDLIVETGIAHGGSLVFYASLLELIGDADSQVLGIDIDIREHNRRAVESHPMAKRITMLQGSAISENIVRQVNDFAKSKRRVMVMLDSNHTHEHVKRELELYSPLVRKGSYLIVFDTAIEGMPEELFPDRPWKTGNNPRTAVWEFLKTNDRFEIDKGIDSKLLVTVAPDGYLRCVRD